MAHAENLEGRIFGELTVIRRNGSNNQNRAMWLCRCSCGVEKTIASHDLKHGTVACGHKRREAGLVNIIKAQKAREPMIKEIKDKKASIKKEKQAMKPQPKHRRLAKIYEGMNARCYNPNHIAYKNYNGRGISICDEWLNDYYKFEEWALNNGYKDTLSIDRIDNDGNYEPSNCRWATPLQQTNNMRNNVIIEIDGVAKTLPQWAREYGINKSTIRMRMFYGKTGRELIKPVERKSNG